MKYLSHFDLLQIRTRVQTQARAHFDLINPDRLHAALAAPRQAVFGAEIRSGLLAKAAILFLRLVENHAFIDGNKRIAVAALQLFLHRNGVQLQAPNEDAIRLANAIALGEANLVTVEDWITAHTRSL